MQDQHISNSDGSAIALSKKAGATRKSACNKRALAPVPPKYPSVGIKGDIQWKSTADALDEYNYDRALYIAGQWAFAEWLGQGNVPPRTLAVEDAYIRLTPPEVPGIKHSQRAQIWLCCAGRAAQNALTGSHYFLDNGDVTGAMDRAGGFTRKSLNIVKKALAEAEIIAGEYLLVPILTAASILYDNKTIEAGDAKALWECVRPLEQPWSHPNCSQIILPPYTRVNRVMPGVFPRRLGAHGCVGAAQRSLQRRERVPAMTSAN
jgi:hypothetical protein